MEVRFFDKAKDYPDVKLWWEKQEWFPVETHLLSSTGFIAETEKTKLAATWIYVTNSSIYIMEWTVGNPDVEWEQRAEAIDLVVETASRWSKTNGAAIVFTMAGHDRLINKLKKQDFIETDTNMTHFVRRL